MDGETLPVQKIGEAWWTEDGWHCEFTTIGFVRCAGHTALHPFKTHTVSYPMNRRVAVIIPKEYR